MNSKRLTLILILILLTVSMQGCRFPDSTQPAPSVGQTPETPAIQVPTNTPGGSADTQAPPPPSGALRLLIQGLDNALIAVDANGAASPFVQADRPFDSLVFQNYSSSRTIGATLYALGVGNEGQTQAFAINTGGVSPLPFILTISQGFALWPGDASQPPRLAWDEATNHPDTGAVSSRLLIGNVDGSGVRSLVEETGPERVLVAGRWSRDGQRLYFSKEPLGLGGYILFGGASNLWAYNLTDNSAVSLLQEPGMACIDDLSSNETLIAHHCANTLINVVEIASGNVTTISPPVEGVEANFVGGARFGPDGQRLAFAIARGDPNNEQGWVAVSDSLSGSSRLIATSQAGDYFQVIGWLNADTLVLQSWGVTPGVWLVKTDGSNLQRLADGVYHGLVRGN